MAVHLENFIVNEDTTITPEKLFQQVKDEAVPHFSNLVKDRYQNFYELNDRLDLGFTFTKRGKLQLPSKSAIDNYTTETLCFVASMIAPFMEDDTHLLRTYAQPDPELDSTISICEAITWEQSTAHIRTTTVELSTPWEVIK